MLSYTMRRLLMLIPVLLGMTLITFSIVHLIPGNPAQVILGQSATQAAIKELEESMGLNEPYFVQYFLYVKGLLQGDLGTSLKTKAAIAKEIWPYIAAASNIAVPNPSVVWTIIGAKLFGSI